MPPPNEAERRRQQGQDIANRTRGAEESAWRGSLRQARSLPPWENLTGGPSATDPGYAIQALQGRTADLMRQQATLPNVRQGAIQPLGSFQQGGTVPETGPYLLHGGEETTVTPPMPAAPPRTSKFGINPGGGGGGNPMLAQMQQNVAAPLHRVEGFQTGGLVPETGKYTLHEGETVIPVTHTTRTDLFAAPEPPKPQAGEGLVPGPGSSRKVLKPTGFSGGYERR